MKLHRSAPKARQVPHNRNDLKSGSVMMRAGTATPERLEIESEDFCEGWDRVRNCEAGVLDKQLRSAGWCLVFLAEPLQAIAIGPPEQETVQQATMKLLGRAGPQMFNCVEVTDIEYRRCVGVPYVHVTGHARHIQRDLEIESFATRKNEINRAAIEADHSGKKAAYVTA
jgi:hypothetical protein